VVSLKVQKISGSVPLTLAGAAKTIASKVKRVSTVSFIVNWFRFIVSLREKRKFLQVFELRVVSQSSALQSLPLPLLFIELIVRV
jgi:hypothetical protein